MSMIPEYLVPGDTIALVSPSYCTPMSNVTGTAEVLRGWGFNVIIGPNVGKRYLGNYAGTLEERLGDFRWALENPEVKCILCNRGGYGVIHFVGHLGPDELKANPKWLVGFSDITTLHSMYSCAGIQSIHGSMCSFIAKSGGKDLGSRLLLDVLTGIRPRYELPAHPLNICGKAVGKLVGGNICTFAPLLGTQADSLAADNLVLFIEEVGETYHNIDRLFNMLLLHGVLDRCRGVILGRFTECKADLEYESAEALIRSYIRDIPLCCGFPAGHEDDNLPLIMGAEVSLEVTPDGATLIF